jgi:hypothetical protein
MRKQTRPRLAFTRPESELNKKSSRSFGREPFHIWQNQPKQLFNRNNLSVITTNQSLPSRKVSRNVVNVIVIVACAFGDKGARTIGTSYDYTPGVPTGNTLELVTAAGCTVAGYERGRIDIDSTPSGEQNVCSAN